MLLPNLVVEVNQTMSIAIHKIQIYCHNSNLIRKDKEIVTKKLLLNSAGVVSIKSRQLQLHLWLLRQRRLYQFIISKLLLLNKYNY